MEERKIFDKKFVHCMWDTELEGKRCIVSDSIDTMIDAVDNGTYHTAVINRSKGGGYALHSNETGSDYIVAYYDPLYNIKWAWKQGQKVEVYGFVGISRAWIEVTEAWKEVPEALKWNENYQYRVRPEEHKLVFASNDCISLDTDDVPCVLCTGTKEQCLKHALDNWCSRCAKFKTCSPDDFCRGFKERKQEKKWRPFKDINELKSTWDNKQGLRLVHPELVEPLIWIRSKANPACTRPITGFLNEPNGEEQVVIIDTVWYNLATLFKQWEFLDGTPTGVVCEE